MVITVKEKTRASLLHGKGGTLPSPLLGWENSGVPVMYRASCLSHDTKRNKNFRFGRISFYAQLALLFFRPLIFFISLWLSGYDTILF